MLTIVARIILRNRVVLLTVLGIITAIMCYEATKLELSYEFAHILPKTDSVNVSYDEFKSKFGLDGNILVVSCQDPNIYQLDKFNDWCVLGDEIKKIKGISEVVSVGRLYNLSKNDTVEKFEFKPLFKSKPATQHELDSIKAVIETLPFYQNIIYNPQTKATVMAINFRKEELDSKNRLDITDSIKMKANEFGKKYNLQMHYSGLPYIRSTIARIVAGEMVMFLCLAIAVTALILFLFFRSFFPVVFSLLVVAVGVAWSFGSIVIFGYKLTILSGLIPPLMIVIGVPNCILLLNKYHSEYSLHGNKGKALSRTIQKISVSLFFANVTTAIGFAVFCSTNTKILYEFGIIASVNVMATYLVSLILIPILFSFLRPPSVKHTKHLKAKRVSKVLEWVDQVVHNHRKKVYVTTVTLVVVSLIGIYLIKPLGYVVDDLPKDHPIYADMNYFEGNFKGVLPFEISIDTKKEKGVFADNGRALYKINNLQKMFVNYPEFSRPVSVVEGVKWAYQAYKDGNPKFYRLPGALELTKVSGYASEAREKQNSFKNFLDSTKRYTRVSIQMGDVGSQRMEALVKELKPRVDSVFNYDSDAKQWLPENEKYKVDITGFCLMFLKGNDFLVQNLMESILLAIILVSLVMFTLFMTARMVFIAVIPSLIPLLITAGIMGFFDIHLKPSTILVFSIAFGIASDGTLYFLTKYRQDMKKHKESISKTVSHAIRETGISMVYTAIILACGFGIFSASQFGGTAALGILVSFTLIVAYCSNLILLPCFLLSLEKQLTTKAFLKDPIVQAYDEDKDIDPDDVEIKYEAAIDTRVIDDKNLK